MNSRINPILQIILFIVFTGACSADTNLFNDVKDLNDLTKQIQKDNAEKASTLVIFDIDDTLLEAVNFVGSNKWYDWQRGKTVKGLNGQPITINEKDQFSCIFRTLGTMFELSSTKLTQQDAAEVVEQLKNYDLMLLTARTTIYRDATERELNKNNINLSNKHLYNKVPYLDFSFNDGNRTAKVTYQNGIAMLSGLNKGLVLKKLLKIIDKSYQHIYFIDDSSKNITNMQKEWQNETTKMNIFHYTRVNKSISNEEIEQSVVAKKQFDQFLSSAYPDRFEAFQNRQCE